MLIFLHVYFIKIKNYLKIQYARMFIIVENYYALKHTCIQTHPSIQTNKCVLDLYVYECTNITLKSNNL